MNHIVTTTEAARCLRLLEQQERPIVAADLAQLLGLAGVRETQRRTVRRIVQRLRDDGAHVVATLQGGYWLTEDKQTWRDWLEHRKIDGKVIIGEAHRRQKALSEGHQPCLFGAET